MPEPLRQDIVERVAQTVAAEAERVKRAARLPSPAAHRITVNCRTGERTVETIAASAPPVKPAAPKVVRRPPPETAIPTPLRRISSP